MGARERPGTSGCQVSGVPGPVGFRGDAGAGDGRPGPAPARPLLREDLGEVHLRFG